MAEMLVTMENSPNERYRLLVQLIPDIVYIIDPEGKFSFVSDSIKMLGYTPAELIGIHFKVLIHPDDYANVAREQVLPRYAGLTTGDELSPKLFDERRSGSRMTTNMEVRLVSKSGSGGDTHVGIISAVNASGQYSDTGEKREYLGTIGIIRDITDLKHAEEEQRRMQEKLNNAQKMEAIGRLAGGVAHDFNNMLSGIMGYAEVIKRRNLNNDGTPRDPEMERFADVIIKATERAGDMTEKLLAFSRRGKYQLIPVNMHDIVREVKGLLGHAVNNCIEIREQLKAVCATVIGDPTQLQNAVLNLGMNASDAMPQGGAITFSTEEIDVDDIFVSKLPFAMKTRRYLLLKVSDTGVGMDEQTKQRLFEPFFTTKQVGEGVGLGLSSVYGTVKNHHGAILANSTLGRGTVFSMYLPLHDAARIEPSCDNLSNTSGKVRILVVDDDEMVCKIIIQFLEGLDYIVSTCGSGGEAINYFRQNRDLVDLVILDINMPIMSGVDCLAQLRKIKPDVKVIISTGNSFQSKTQKIIASGVDGFVRKPFNLDEFAEEIKRVLNKK
jgi:PAS domain S-box-containing protein